MVAFRMEPTPEDLDNKKNNFQEFCQQTSLHGWQHIQRVNTIKGRVVWFSIVLASLAVASLFLATAAKDFVLRSVVTTIETTTGPLQVRLLILRWYGSDYWLDIFWKDEKDFCPQSNLRTTWTLRSRLARIPEQQSQLQGKDSIVRWLPSIEA